MKRSSHDIATEFVNLTEHLPGSMTRYFLKRFTEELGEGVFGRHDEARANTLLGKVRRAVGRHRTLVKNDRSWGADGGPADLQTNISETELRVLWEDVQPETYTFALEELIRAMVDRGHSAVDSLALAQRVTKALPPPQDPRVLDAYHVRAVKYALATDPHERLRIAGEGL